MENKKKAAKSRCEDCEFYDYDEYYGQMYCKQSLDEDEFLGTERIPLEKAVEMVMNNEIFDSKTQTAILKIANISENRK